MWIVATLIFVGAVAYMVYLRTRKTTIVPGGFRATKSQGGEHDEEGG